MRMVIQNNILNVKRYCRVKNIQNKNFETIMLIHKTDYLLYKGNCFVRSASPGELSVLENINNLIYSGFHKLRE